MEGDTGGFFEVQFVSGILINMPSLGFSGVLALGRHSISWEVSEVQKIR